MAYNQPQNQRYPGSQSRTGHQGGRSQQFNDYDNPPYEPTGYDMQEDWRENRDFREGEGYPRYQHQAYQSERMRPYDDNYFRGATNYGAGEHNPQDYSIGGSERDWAQQMEQRGRHYGQTQFAGRSGFEQRPYSGQPFASQPYSSQSYPYTGQTNYGGQQGQYFGGQRSGQQDWGQQGWAQQGGGFEGSQRRYGTQGMSPRNRASWEDSWRQSQGASPGWQNSPSRDLQDEDFGGASPTYGSSGYAGGYSSQQAGLQNRGFQSQSFRGRSPKGYERSDERIREDICERLTHDHMIDASEISVTVKSGVVTLEGTINDRNQKYHAEDLADNVSGVKDVQNRLNVSRSMQGSSSQSDRTGAGQMGAAQQGTGQESASRTSTQNVTRQ